MRGWIVVVNRVVVRNWSRYQPVLQNWCGIELVIDGMDVLGILVDMRLMIDVKAEFYHNPVDMTSCCCYSWNRLYRNEEGKQKGQHAGSWNEEGQT